MNDGERRQLTVLFCDMVGFTELTSRVDPEILREIISTYEEACAACVSRYGGHVFQRLGDGIVAFFGYPLAHEGEAERAIRAALDMVETFEHLAVEHVGRIQVRIGIASGVVVVSSADGSAVGVTMNLAARLQGIAEPGTIVIAEGVHRLAPGVFEYDDLGELSLKGMSKKPRAYRVRGRSGAVSRFQAATQHGVTPLVGRRDEVDFLLELWREAQNGQGRMALISGEPGIGKSRTIGALREHLEARGARTMTFQCSPFSVNSAFHPSIDALGRALRFERDESADSKLDKLHSLVAGTLGLPAADVRFLAGILSIPAHQRFPPIRLSARRQKEEAMRVLVDMTEATARARPTLMLFEDAHWADPSTLGLLDLLVRRLADFPLLTLVTHRPEFTSRWPGEPHVTSRDLMRLSHEDGRVIVAQLARGKALPSPLVEDIVAKADGVPLFLEEVTKAVLESGNLTELDDRWEYAARPADLVLPATLRDSLMARLDHLGDAKEVAQIGAVVGRDFSYELVAAVAPLKAHALSLGLARLTEAGLAFREGEIPGASYTFKHALVQDVAYDSLLKSRRAELHGAIAQSLLRLRPETAEHTPEVLARHFAAAGLHESAIVYWHAAGERAVLRTALPEAIAHLRVGLASLDQLPRTPELELMELRLRTRLGQALLAHQGWAWPEVGVVLEPAWRLAEAHGEGVLPVAYGLWVHHMSAGQLAESMHWAERLLEVAAATHDEILELSGRRAALTSRFWQGDLMGARAHGDRLRAVYDPARHSHIGSVTTSDPLAGDGIYRAHYLWMLGYPDQALAVARETAEHLRALNNPLELGLALTLGAQVHEYCDDPALLHQCASEAERVGKAFGVPLMSEIMAEISKGMAWLLDGRLDEGVSQLRESARRLNGTGHRVWLAYLGVRVGEAIARAGDPAGGLQLVNESLARQDCREDGAHTAEMLRIKAGLLRSLGETSEAESILHESLRVARAQHAKSWELRASMDLARVLRDRGERQAAHDLLAPVYLWFTEGHTTRDLTNARQLLDELQ